MNTEELRLYIKEEHKLIMRILLIVEYANLTDLKKINKWLNENGYASKTERTY